MPHWIPAALDDWLTPRPYICNLLLLLRPLLHVALWQCWYSYLDAPSATVCESMVVLYANSHLATYLESSLVSKNEVIPNLTHSG